MKMRIVFGGCGALTRLRTRYRGWLSCCAVQCFAGNALRDIDTTLRYRCAVLNQIFAISVFQMPSRKRL